MPYFSLRHQKWQGAEVVPGDLIDDVRDMRSLVIGRYAMYAPEGFHIERHPDNSSKWLAVPGEWKPPDPGPTEEDKEAAESYHREVDAVEKALRSEIAAREADLKDDPSPKKVSLKKKSKKNTVRKNRRWLGGK